MLTTAPWREAHLLFQRRRTDVEASIVMNSNVNCPAMRFADRTYSRGADKARLIQKFSEEGEFDLDDRVFNCQYLQICILDGNMRCSIGHRN